ncbi:HNH endonuclease [Amphibacillus xylanus]|uniref:HNH nuclease domain-containing protein n=1 Tax=Amphibacillus xylanus (strain ATCC 51415 / DSM 6626 / JCM 7361 / LMG 17667 / NBRC 15112 / Ep01) TaxID=698758 RepID=K0J557_AMPXN|nr:HNH endonuclease [Amphibacillus xylanus]BAM48016.1 hypothetical protein AXY_18840 [Amphibacillus xylanus NBRC 15112]
MEFSEWLHTNTALADSSIDKYSRAVNTISKEMIQIGVIKKPLMEMEALELEMAITLILLNPDFLAKDKRGNKMYSNSLKQFKYYYLSSRETTNNFEQNLLYETEQDYSISETTRKAIINARIGQGVFKNELLKKYSRCIITKVDNKKLLIASHIKPWAVSDNQERISVDNGFLLTPTFDKLFDIGLITFDANSRIKVSQFVGKKNEERLNIRRNANYDLKLNEQVMKNLEYHNDIIFVS